MRIAIIGAGMTGITCAHALADAGQTCTVFEKSRGLGGRLATRRAGDLRFDHGAQYVRAKTDGFRAYLNRHAVRWNTAGLTGDAFVGAPGMSALVKPMADRLDIRLGEQVTPLREGPHWRIGDAVFDRVISTVPAPQARVLFPDMIPALSTVEVWPNWTLMIAFNTPADWPETHRDADADLSWMARNSAKPNRSAAPESWVIQASSGWSQQHLELSKEDACARMLECLRTARGDMPSLHYAAAHRWRYATTRVPLGQAHVASDDGTVLIGGDWCLGARVEDAYRSGLSLAAAL